MGARKESDIRVRVAVLVKGARYRRNCPLESCKLKKDGR
jgi:hypothetical protein